MSNENLTRTTGFEQPAITHNAIVTMNLAPTDMENNFSTARGDGYAVRATDTTITLSGVASITTNQIRKVVVDDGTLIRVLEQGHNSVRIAVSGTGPYTLTVVGAGTAPVPAGCTVDVLWAGQDKGFDAPTNSIRSFPVTDLASKRITTPISIASAQAFTGAWVALGPVLNTDGFTKISIFLNLNFTAPKNSLNPRIRLRCANTAAGTLFSLPIVNTISTASPYYALVDPEYVEFNTVADQTIVLTWETSNTIPYVQFEISAGTAGATPAVVTTAEVTFGWS